MADERELKLKVRVDDKASKPLKEIGDQADDTTRDLQEMNLGLKKLDDKVAEATRTIGDLRKEIGRTGDLDLIKDITKQEQRLKALAKQRKTLLGDIDLKKAGSDAADDFSLSFAGRIGPLMARAPLSPGLLAATAVAAPMVANVVAGAVTGALGGGAVVAGIALAARDERVQSEAKGLADEIGSVLSEAAGPFVPATVKAIGIVRDEFGAMDDDLEDIFKNAAGYVEPLVRGAAGFVGEMVPGIRDAVAEGGPFFEMLERELPELGRDVGELFSTMADHAEDGAEAVGKILDTMGAIADTTGTVVDVLDVLMAIGSFDPTSQDSWDELKSSWDALVGNEGKLVLFKENADGAAGGIRNVGDAASEAAIKVETLSTAIDRMGNENLDARAAVRGLEAAYDAASEAVKKNGATLDESTPKGRANAEALDKIVREAKRARDAIIAQKGSQGEANAVMEQARTNFIKTAEAMGMDAIAARKLADALFGIPSPNPKVNLNTADARAAVDAFMRKYREVKNKSVTIHGYVKWTSSGLKVPGGTILERAHGGPIEGPGPKGVDSVPMVGAPGEHVLTAQEVDAAGGHRAIEAWRRSLLSGRPSPPVGGGGFPGAAARAVIELRADQSRMSQLAMTLFDMLVLPEVRRRGGLTAAFRGLG